MCLEKSGVKLQVKTVNLPSGFGTIRIKINHNAQAVADKMIQQSRIDVTNDRK
jgi:hypothetical protein